MTDLSVMLEVKQMVADREIPHPSKPAPFWAAFYKCVLDNLSLLEESYIARVSMLGPDSFEGYTEGQAEASQ